MNVLNGLCNGDIAGTSSQRGCVVVIAIDPRYQVRALIGQVETVRAAEVYIQRVVEGSGLEGMRMVRRGDLDWQLYIDHHLDGIRDQVWALMESAETRLVTSGAVEVFLDLVVGVADTALLRARRPDLDITESVLVACADAALARAMATGARGAVYEIGQVESIRKELCTAVQLARSEPSDFLSVYQPIFAVGGSEPRGYEALLRWRRDGRVLKPADFIDEAESTSLIVPIGRRLVEQAIEALATQIGPRCGGDSFITVNLSPRQLADHHLAEQLQAMVGKHGIPPERVWLEIREDSVIGLNSPEQRMVEALDESGFVVCVDDLGAGYSALSYLRDLPVRAVKIDRSIISRLAVSDVDRQLVRAIKTMVDGQGIVSVAEGIETQEVYDVAADLGLDYVQGYLFGVPLPTVSASAPA